MTPAQIEKAQDFLRRRSSILSWILGKKSHATVTIYGPSQYGGRDYISTEIDLDRAVDALRRELADIEYELKKLGVEFAPDSQPQSSNQSA